MSKKRDKYEIEEHPFEISIPKDATTLILGTFPSKPEDRHYEYFYASETNLFWNIISQVYKINFKCAKGNKAKEERKEFLHSKKIGVYDMIKMCYRKNGSPNDEDLYPIKITNLFKILNDFPNINKIILTSRTPVFGAYGLVCSCFYKNNKIPFEIYDSTEVKKLKEGYFEYNGKEIDVYVPQSTSKRNQNNVDENELIKMYKYCLIK
jgi:hypoxanthine-DNA glycosylase